MSAILGRIELDSLSVNHATFSRAFERRSTCTFDSSLTHVDRNLALGMHVSGNTNSPICNRLFDNDHEHIVLGDAVLDNREELAQSLDIATISLKKLADLDLIRLSFAKWGESCVDRLFGDFAFAIISDFGQRVFLARDHIGTRPLFYALRDNTFMFGSFIEDIVNFCDFDWKIDERTVSEYVQLPITALSRTFFEHINRVPPGSFLKVSDGTLSETEWWKPSTRKRGSFKSDEQLVSEGKALVESAIKNRVSTSQPIGSHISGGIDSTGVTLLAHDILASQGRSLTAAYSWVPPVSEKHPIQHERDERSFLNDVTSAKGIPITYGRGDLDNLLRFLLRPIEFENQSDLMDEVPILESAERDGIGIMLSGWGADEVFSSHSRHYVGSLIYSGKWRSAKRFIQNTYGSLRSPRVLATIIFRELVLPLVPSVFYKRMNSKKLLRGYDSFLSETLRTRYRRHLSKRHETQRMGLSQAKTHLQQLKGGHLAIRMEAWALWSCQHGFQYRYPLLDRHLLEFLLTLPSEIVFLNDRPRGLALEIFKAYGSDRASKEDFANEEHKRQLRFEAWQLWAKAIQNNEFQDECPWIDKERFFRSALNPRVEEGRSELATFIHLFTTVRVWNLYRRAKTKGWI